MRRNEHQFDVWMVVADVLIGFLCVMTLLYAHNARSVPAVRDTPTPTVPATPTATPTPKPTGSPGHVRPAAIVQFEQELTKVISRTPGKVQLDSEFSSVHLTYGEKLLFRSCEWSLSDEGRHLLLEHFEVLAPYNNWISRIQIEGHADSRKADSCVTLARAGLRRDNWILSSLRALEVRDFLEKELQVAATEVGPVLEGTADVARDIELRKIEACGRGDLHPLDPGDPTSEVNRRIEVTVHFIESDLSIWVGFGSDHRNLLRRSPELTRPRLSELTHH